MPANCSTESWSLLLRLAYRVNKGNLILVCLKAPLMRHILQKTSVGVVIILAEIQEAVLDQFSSPLVGLKLCIDQEPLTGVTDLHSQKNGFAEGNN
ncbi:hypothetical protein E2562_007277 [Oryza meyeriana var. granulata]|uniref:Uncharacterized protein n=1 Tax=Oryza meyeriana var. granulata TaxID=110450 RepID=A0A6G1CEG3_9ORYZ|nr:hypothetical protein E2562_007277 [Oryza meyeriana var. granulata]